MIEYLSQEQIFHIRKPHTKTVAKFATEQDFILFSNLRYLAP